MRLLPFHKNVHPPGIKLGPTAPEAVVLSILPRGAFHRSQIRQELLRAGSAYDAAP